MASRSRITRSSARLPAPRSPRLLAIVALVLVPSSVAAWALIDRSREMHPAMARPAVAADAFPSQRIAGGPWGELETQDVILEPRSGYLHGDMCRTEAPTWREPGGPAEVSRILDGAALPPAKQAAFHAFTSCQSGGCASRPPLDFLAALSPVERTSLYAGLGRIQANVAQRMSPRRPPGEWQRVLADTGMSPGSLELARSLTWRDGTSEVISDVEVLCERLPSDDRERWMRAAVRASSVLATLHVRPGADLDEIAAYWGVGTRHKDIRSLLASLAAAPGGGRIDILHLVPRFVREHVNSYPEVDDPPRNCHYGALNFFEVRADERLAEPAFATRTFATDYVPVGDSALRLGDLLVFQGPDGKTIHSAAYVAGDLVFTKNGAAFSKPWVLMHRAELETELAKPRVVPYRRKDLL